MTQEEVKKMAEAHWDWLESVLATQRAMEKKIAIEFFIHGWKHCEEEHQNERS